MFELSAFTWRHVAHVFFFFFWSPETKGICVSMWDRLRHGKSRLKRGYVDVEFGPKYLEVNFVYDICTFVSLPIYISIDLSIYLSIYLILFHSIPCWFYSIQLILFQSISFYSILFHFDSILFHSINSIPFIPIVFPCIPFYSIIILSHILGPMLCHPLLFYCYVCLIFFVFSIVF